MTTIPMPDGTALEIPDLSVERCVSVITAAAKANMADPERIPESDKDKLELATSLLQLALQSKIIVDQIGAGNVPLWPLVREVLAEGGALDGGAPAAPAPTPEPAVELEPPMTEGQKDMVEAELSEHHPQGELDAARAELDAHDQEQKETVEAAAAALANEPISKMVKPDFEIIEVYTKDIAYWLDQNYKLYQEPEAEEAAAPAPPAPVSDPNAGHPQANQVWADQNGELWGVVTAGSGPQLEAKYLRTGEITVLPSGFLKHLAPPEVQEEHFPTAPPAPVVPQDTSMVPAAAPLVTPEPTPTPDEIARQLATVTEPNHQLVQESPPSAPSVPSSAPASPPSASPTPTIAPALELTLAATPAVEPTPPAPAESSGSSSEPSGSASPEPSAPSSPPESSSSPGSSEAQDPPAPRHEEQIGSIPVDHDEGDEQYRKILDDVDAQWTPRMMPVPQEFDREPSPMPDDLTPISDIEARRLHSQFNALAARARLLAGVDRAKAKRCARARSLAIKQPMREARAELGKDASVTEVTSLASEHQEVSKWIEREQMHSDRADAWETFLRFYTEDVQTLSRDWTMRAEEQKAS